MHLKSSCYGLIAGTQMPLYFVTILLCMSTAGGGPLSQ